jgi:hypothetical protein
MVAGPVELPGAVRDLTADRNIQKIWSAAQSVPARIVDGNLGGGEFWKECQDAQEEGEGLACHRRHSERADGRALEQRRATQTFGGSPATVTPVQAARATTWFRKSARVVADRFPVAQGVGHFSVSGAGQVEQGSENA